MRLPLIDGQGNFGSMDPDPPASMRYTEARLAKSAMALLADLDKDTVDFSPTMMTAVKSRRVLPARFPNLLVNGAGGIAVGMATNIRRTIWAKSSMPVWRRWTIRRSRSTN